MRYVYLNPVRAGMVSRAADYAWSWIAAFDAPFAGSVPEDVRAWMFGVGVDSDGGFWYHTKCR